MRMTVDLDDDLVELINQEKLRTGLSMKQIVNRGFRDGLARLEAMDQADARQSEHVRS